MTKNVLLDGLVRKLAKTKTNCVPPTNKEPEAILRTALLRLHLLTVRMQESRTIASSVPCWHFSIEYDMRGLKMGGTLRSETTQYETRTHERPVSRCMFLFGECWLLCSRMCPCYWYHIQRYRIILMRIIHVWARCQHSYLNVRSLSISIPIRWTRGRRILIRQFDP